MKRAKRSDSGNEFHVFDERQHDILSDRNAMNDSSSLHRTLSVHQNSFEPRLSPQYNGFNADHDDGLNHNPDDFLL